MEPVKKRRNSILKKKPLDEDTTTEIKARRISFSGKKSIKEFIAGEEAETIWGTSYEESADDLKVSSSESGLVNVNGKRIQLRSRRIICEPQQPQQKRRSSSKKKAKVQIAANDKENVYVIPINPSPPPTQPPTENASTSFPVIGEVVEQLQSINPQMQSELAPVRTNENVSILKDTMPPSSPPKGLSVAGLPDMFINTFDFINISGRINKTISISHSVDVTLNESEMQMFKFRMPVTPTEISPNTSNILTQSILMTDDDVNSLKLAQKQNGDVNTVMEQMLIDEELRLIDARKRVSGGTEDDRSKTSIVGEVVESNEVAVASNSMEITQMNDFMGGSKRKSERTPISIFMDSTLNEMNSPLRKKSMQTLYGISMDVTDNAHVKSTQMNTTSKESITIDDSIQIDETTNANQWSINQGKQTTHFDSVIINESTLCGLNYTSSQSSSFPNTTASCLAMGHQTGDMSMELSICDTRHQEPVQTKCQTMHLPQDGQMECTLIEEQQVVYSNKENIYDEISAPNKANEKQRESIYTPSDIVEESSPKTSQESRGNKQKGLTMRQTILSGEQIIEDSPKEIVNPRSVLQTTITTPVHIFEDSIQVQIDNERTQNIRKIVHQPEDESPIEQKSVSSRESIYTPSDMVEDSPKSSDTDKSSKVGVKINRRTIVIAKSIVADVSKIDDSKTIAKSKEFVQPIMSNESIMDLEEPNETTSRNTQLQKSVYTPSEILEESPGPSSKSLKSRQTICMPEDIDESITGVCNTEKLQKTIKTPIEIFEDSLQLPDSTGGISKSLNMKPVEGPKKTKENKSRESIYTPSDMIEVSAQNPQPSNFKVPKTRQTILIPENIAKESPKSIPSAINQHKGNKPRHSIYIPTDMVPPSPKSSQSLAESIYMPGAPFMKEDSKQMLQNTITTAIDIFEDSMQERPPIKQSRINRQTIYDNADIEKDNGPTECIKSNSKRQTTYEADITLEPAVLSSEKSAVGERLRKPSKLRPPSQVQVFRRQLSSTELTSKSTLQKTYKKSKSEDNLSQQNQCPSKIPEFKSNLTGRQSIHIPVDMDEDSAEPQHKTHCAPSDIKTVAAIEKTHHQTIITQEDMQTDSPSTSTGSLVKTKQRQTINTPMEILETSIQAPKSVMTKPLDVPYDLPYRKPNKLIVEPSKSSENPYSSPNSLMNKVMQDMGYSMNFQLDFPQPNHQLAEQKTSQSRHMYSLKDFDPSMNIFSTTQVNNSTRPMEVSTVEDRTSQLCKTSFNQSLMEMSGFAKTLTQERLPTSLMTMKRETMHLHQDLDVEEPISTPSISQKEPLSQTMIGEEDLDIEDTDESAPQLSKTRLDKKHCNDLQESSIRSANQSVMKSDKFISKSGRKTMHLQEDLEVEGSFSPPNGSFKGPLRNSENIKPGRKTMHLHEDLEVEGNISPPNGSFKGPLQTSENMKPGRKTMHLHEDLEVEGNLNRANISFKGSLQSSKNIERQTVHRNDKIDEIENQLERIQIHKSQKRQTILMDQDLDMSVSGEIRKDVSRPSAITIIPQSTKRQTNHLNENLCVEDGKSPNKQQTILMRQELDMTEVQGKTLTLMPSSSSKVHQTTYFQQEHQDCSMEQSFDQIQRTMQLETEPKRKTILLNEDLEYGRDPEPLTKSMRPTSNTNDRKTMHINEKIEEQKEEKIDIRRTRQTILMSQDLDLSEVVDIPKSSNRQTTNLRLANENLPNNQQTILLRQELDITQAQDKTLKIMPSSSSKVQQNTYNHQEVDMEQSFDCKQESAQHKQLKSSLTRTTRNIRLKKKNTAPNRKTMLLNEDVEFEGLTESLPKSPLPDRENLEDRKNEKKPKEIGIHLRRQTILMNQDLDISEVVNIQEVSPQAPERISSKFRPNDFSEDVFQRRANRQTIHFNQDLEQSLCSSKDQHFGASSKRQTILIKQDLDLTMPQECIQRDNQLSLKESQGQDLEKSANQNNFSYETRRNTEVNAYRCHRVETSEALSKNSTEGTEKRQTIHFANDQNMDESGVSQWNATEDNKQASRRVTIIHEEQPINTDDSMLPKPTVQIHSKKEEMIPINIQNRPRRVTICEDQPPMELDESLLAPKSTARKSSFSRTLNFDEIPTTRINASSANNSSSLSKSRITWQPSVLSKDDESPIYNPKSKPKPPMTPEVDRSLAEYLKIEAAVEEQQEEEEIFYDAEDGTDKPSPRQNNHRQTCHMPASILEESGMQPLSSQTLSQSCKRKTTFSPREMSDESLHPEQSMEITHAAIKTNKIPLAITSESHQSAHQNRQTQYFNESINTADVSITWPNPRSAAVQSMKALLAENTRLLTHLNEMQQNEFETKRSTMFFAGKDDSMEVSCVDVDKSPRDMTECTPTKSKTSRIPQLIGSAKKLECLKKSMEFIQQELPNIRSQLRKSGAAVDQTEELMMIDNDETPKRFSTSIPKKLKEMPEESFNKVDVAEKPANSPPTAHLDESFETVDIPRKAVSSIRKTIDQSIQQAVMQETFDAVRRATTFQRNDTLHICPNEMEVTANASRKSFFQTDDAPITISDVSTFFSQKLLSNPPAATETNSPCPTDAICKADEPEFKGFPRSSDALDTTHNLADFNKRYVDLSDLDSASIIEKTHLSLVNTIDDASEMVNCQSGIQTKPDSEIPSPDIAAKDAVIVEKEPLPPQKPNSSICRKCKCARLSTTTSNETTLGSFMLDPLPVYKIDLSELEQLKKKPNILDVGKVWRQKMRESDSFNVSDGSRSMAMADENAEDIQMFLKELAEERLLNAQLKQQTRNEVKIETSFVHRVRMKIQSEPNWLVHELLLLQNTILLTHKRMRTFAIVIYFTPKDPRGVEVTFNDIKFKKNQFHTRQWKPIEHVQHYQLLFELPFDLKTICPTSENFFELLEHVDKVTQDVLITIKEMQSLILPSPASLIREPTGRICIRKKFRTKTPQNYVKHTEFHIEVRNIKKLSFESITMPPLYEFDEKIQLLPVGNDFLRIFLNEPMQFLKT